MYGRPKVRKISHIKKISLPRYPPTLWRPRETHRRPAWGVLYKNRAILWERRAPPPSGSWVITTGTGVGKYFQLWRSDRVGGTAFLISVGVWGAPLPAAFVNSMLYNVLYKCDAGDSHNSKKSLWQERPLGLPFFANRSGRVTASRGFPGPLFLVFVWSLFWPLVFTQQARAEKIDPQKPAYFLVFSRGEKPVKMQESCFKSCHLDHQAAPGRNSRTRRSFFFSPAARGFTLCEFRRCETRPSKSNVRET